MLRTIKLTYILFVLSNIFITEENRIRIGDLGSAKVINGTIRTMTNVGTYPYMSPEQYHDGVCSNATDIWLEIIMANNIN